MHCTNCGAELLENAKFCTECGCYNPTPRPKASPTAYEAPAASAPATELPPVYTKEVPFETPAPRKYRGRLVLAIIACCLFFVPTGIPAIVFAAKAGRLSKKGRAGSARRAARLSTLFAVLSVICNIVWNAIGLLLLIKKYGG